MVINKSNGTFKLFVLLYANSN